MKIAFKNFIQTLSRFKMASALNIIGLTIAFSVFIVIMSNYRYETSINQDIKNVEDLYFFTMDIDLGEGEVTNAILSRGLAREIRESSPLIEDHTSIFLFINGKGKYNIEGSEKFMLEESYIATPSYIDIFSLECVDGDLKNFYEPNSMIIPKSIADKYFSDSSPIGQKISRDDILSQTEGDKVELNIVGVYKDLPENSLGNRVIENVGDYQKTHIMSAWNFIAFYKLKPGADPEQAIIPARDRIREINDEKEVTSIDEEKTKLVPMKDLYFTDLAFNLFPSGNKMMLNILLAVALIIILIASINYTNFFMALVPIRIRSININKVFGAPTKALRANIIFESVGIMLITFCLSLGVVELIAGTAISDFSSVSLKIRDSLVIVGWTLVLALAIGLISGLFPAWYITKFSPTMVLRGSFGRSKSGRIYRQGLTIFQFIISITLVIISLFVILQNKYMKDYDYGYNRDNLLYAGIPISIYEKYNTLEAEINKSPLFEGSALVGQKFSALTSTNGAYHNGGSIVYKQCYTSYKYPELMELELIEGRFFTKEDEYKEHSVSIVNETAAREHVIKLGDVINGATVVGIVKDFNYRSLKENIGPVILGCGSRKWQNLEWLYVRMTPDANIAEAVNFLRESILAADPSIPADAINIIPVNTDIESLYTKEQQTATFISIFSLVSIVISLLGVFGMVVFEMQHSRKEVAVRKVYGASLGEILFGFNRKILRVLGVSSAVALPLGWYAVDRWLSGFAYRTPMHWWVFAAGVLLVFIITLLIVNVHTTKAASEDPTKNLMN